MITRHHMQKEIPIAILNKLLSDHCFNLVSFPSYLPQPSYDLLNKSKVLYSSCTAIKAVHVLMIICLKCNTFEYYSYNKGAENSLRTLLEGGKIFHQFPQALDQAQKTSLCCTHGSQS